MTRWIEATPQQRAAIVARANREEEAKRRTPAFQAGLRKHIAGLESQIAAKEAELAAGGFARRLHRQIDDLRAELAFQMKEVRP